MIGHAGAGMEDLALVLSYERGEVILQARLIMIAEEGSNRNAEGIGYLLQGADGGRGDASLHLADEARGHPDFLREFFQCNPAMLPELPDLKADLLHSPKPKSLRTLIGT